MTITTEEAERLARCGLDLMDDPPNRDDEILINAGDLDDMTTALRSLAAERDALRSENKKLRAALRQIADQSCDTFQINPEGGQSIAVEGHYRFAFEEDVKALLAIARAALGEKA